MKITILFILFSILIYSSAYTGVDISVAGSPDFFKCVKVNIKWGFNLLKN
jgi:membrane protein involved in colicin uptake